MATKLLEPGDVLLSLGISETSNIIKMMDGGEYSHAAIWSGQTVIESTTPKVIERSLNESLKHHPRVHVRAFRHKYASKEKRQVVVSVARNYVDRPYPRGDLVLCGALMAVTSFIPKPSQLKLLRDVCNTISAFKVDRASKDELVTCTQLVVRAYSVAGLPIRIQPKGPNQFDLWTMVRGVSQLAVAKDAAAMEGLDPDTLEWFELQAALRAQWAGAVTTGANPSGEKAIPRDWDGAFPILSEGEWRSALVTPFNLQESTDFDKIGDVHASEDGDPPRVV
jgi:hypothetical protein